MARCYAIAKVTAKVIAKKIAKVIAKKTAKVIQILLNLFVVVCNNSTLWPLLYRVDEQIKIELMFHCLNIQF